MLSDEPDLGPSTTPAPTAVLSPGARLSIVAGLLLWVVAAGFFYVPAWVQTEAGFRIDCGSAASPVLTPEVSAACSPEPERNRVVGLALLSAGVLVGVGGAASFGLRPRKAPSAQSGDHVL